MGGMLKKLLKSILDMAASLPSGLSPELLLPQKNFAKTAMNGRRP